MAKNKKNSQSRGNGDRRSDKNRILLVLAILFFLFGLWMFLRSAGYSFGSDGLLFNNGTRNGAPGINGAPGTGSGSGSGTGTNGAGGQDGTGGENGTSGDGTNVNINSETGLDVDAGIDENGNIYISPQVNPNTNGNTDTEINLNDDKVIDTNVLP